MLVHETASKLGLPANEYLELPEVVREYHETAENERQRQWGEMWR